jgi:hypothetical protein
MPAKVNRGSALVPPTVCVACRAAASAAVLLFAPFLSAVASDGVGAGVEVDLVAFFRAAVSRPPDVEYFAASQRNLRDVVLPARMRARVPTLTNGVMYFEGARSGTSFFLREVNPAAAPTNTATEQLVVGRRDSENYHLNPNTLYYSHDAPETASSNTLVSSVSAFYSIANQFLSMGLGDVEAGSVKWDGNDFSGLRQGALPTYGHLEISNGRPVRLLMSAAKGKSPFKAITYEYPGERNNLDGFPSKIVIWALFSGSLQPLSELRLANVKLSSQLPGSFFDRAKFVGPNIKYTNVFSNAVVYSVLSGGALIKAPKQPQRQSSSAAAYRGVIIGIMVFLTVALPVPFLVLKYRAGKSGLT